ncbi:hypothetical protein Ddye_029439 [Dipteronia dyeriana]|uniref:Polyprotein n=1 Tax=Dipteronia dyeriana TaxID=168575 RepID=A0AAD9TF48_9ROSI|nr:hypothetical protein Ddye_029439 [Dipteronia dyeriana]
MTSTFNIWIPLYAETYSLASSEQSYHSGSLSNSDALLDLSQIFTASRTDPQPSTQTVETPSDETSDEPTLIVDEPPEHRPQAPAHVPKPTNGPWFNLEDYAPDQWRPKMSEMSIWLDLQTAKLENNTETILREFVSRFTGSLRDWYQALGEYRQLQYMFFRYHALGGINDESLRQVYLNSLPKELQGELQRTIELSNKTLRDITFREIHMFTLTALDKLCATERVFTKMIKEGRNNKKNRKYKYYQKKARRSWNKSNKCFASGQQGHYTKQCPNKRIKSAKPIQQLRHIANDVPSDANIESIFSERDDVKPCTTFMIQDSDDFGLSSESSDYSEPDFSSEAYQATNGSSLSLGPQIQKKKDNEFLANDGQIFTTNLVSKQKIGIQFFPTCTLWTHVIGTPIPDKDIVIGWDIYSQSKFIRILPTGIRFKREFKPFSNIPKHFPLSAINPNFQQIQKKLLTFFTNSHVDFRHPKPL